MDYVIEKQNSWTLSAKTGTGIIQEEQPITWYVGYVERAGDVYFFAFNMTGDNTLELINQRTPIARSILAALGVLPLN